eukprot:3563374-Rhodomonas_salina.1
MAHPDDITLMSPSSNAGVFAISSWDATNGALVLSITAGRTMHVGHEYTLSFAIENGGSVQDGGTMEVFVGGMLSGVPERLTTTATREADAMDPSLSADATPLRSAIVGECVLWCCFVVA